MLARDGLTAQEALICTMVLVAAAEERITDREIGVMSGLVQTLPVFHHFLSEQLDSATESGISLLREEDGIAHAGRLIRRALEPRLRETAYALACEIIAADRFHSEDVMEMLDQLREELELDRLVTAAIERGARARFQRLERSDP